MLATFSMNATGGDVVVGESYVYCLPDATHGDAMAFVNLPGGTVRYWDGSWSGATAALTTDGMHLVIASDLEPSDLTLVDVGTDAPTTAGYSFKGGDEHDACGRVWLSKDDRWAFTGCGAVFDASSVTYRTTLPAPAASFLGSMDDHSADGTTAALFIPFSGPPAQSVLSTFDASLTVVRSDTLPAMPDGSQATGMFVFHDAAGTGRFVMIEVTRPGKATSYGVLPM